VPYPTAWKLYVSEKKKNDSVDPNLAVVAARYRLASEFHSLVLQGFSAPTAKFYSSVTKLGLAYSCLEHLEKVTDSSWNAILDPELARQVRSTKFKPIAENALDQLESKKAILALKRLMEDQEQQDIRPIVVALRHSLFHGQFTPGSTGLKATATNLKFLEELGQATLRTIDNAFSIAIESKVAQYN
jgi:hypothetical protein